MGTASCGGSLRPHNISEMVAFLRQQQRSILDLFESIDGSGACAQMRSWDRPGGGGGEMGVLRGKVVEKGACNVSQVHGKYPKLDSVHATISSSERQRAGKSFYATGLSTIVHMYNPRAPIAHMNVRLFQVGDDFWFGGGADLTPFIPFAEDTEEFHGSLQQLCSRHHPQGEEAYHQYRSWCDEYFYIEHRREVRGVGGIFFDHLRGEFKEIFGFIKALCTYYAEVLGRILQRRCREDFTAAQKEQQLHWRSRYVEFNLIYDRGTAFGLKSGGDLQAILVSLPPVVKW